MADVRKNIENKTNLQLTMKVEEPCQDSKTGKDEDDIECVKEYEKFEVCSPSKISTNISRNPYVNWETNSTTRGILKPPQLSLNNISNSTKSSFVLNPSQLNPYSGTSSNANLKDLKNNQINGETPKFVPLIHSEPKKTNGTQPAVTATTTTLSSGSFIFGQNLQDRVVNSETKCDEPKPSTSLNSNGTIEMLFSNAVKSEIKIGSNINNKETKSLSESAREYEESRAIKRKYEEVEVITGEENETNILNINCKLFAFDKASGNWQERGRGILRLNDFEGDGHVQSRLLFRTTGIWKVALNTKIWAEMTVEQASDKSIRFTALDSQGVIRVFLIMASIEDSKQLYSQIKFRVQQEMGTQKHKKISVKATSGSN